MDTLSTKPCAPKRVLLLGFGSVGQHYVLLLLAKSRQRPRPELCVTALSDSSGGIFCAAGLPLAAILSWKQAGNQLNTFVGNQTSMTYYTDSLQMVQASAQVGDIVLDATPVNLTDGGIGMSCCRWAAQHGVHLVLANKAPLVLNYQQLMRYSLQEPASFIEFSGTVCGGLPVINIGRRDLSCCARLDLVQGIFNSTSNYILSRMASGEAPEVALANAREVGIAEADASLDLEGFDTANKLVIICNAVLDIPVTLREVEREGMTQITAREVEAAGLRGEVYRLVATAERDLTHPVHCHAETTDLHQGEQENRTERVEESEVRDTEGKREEERRRQHQCAGWKLSVRPTLVPTASFFGQCVDTDMCAVLESDEFETISLKTNEKGVFPTAAAMMRDCCTIIKKSVGSY